MGRLSRCQSLKKKVDFDRLYQSRKRWHDKRFALFALMEKKECRVGFVASKKIGNAVKRARAKRRLRALFLHHLPYLKDGQYVLVAKPPILDAPFEELIKSFSEAIDRLRLRKP